MKFSRVGRSKNMKKYDVEPQAVVSMVECVNFEKSHAMRAKVHEVIPGGTHTYAKGDDQFPQQSPGFIARGKGCHIWDIDGNEFIEYGMGLRAVTLGHAYAPVMEAAYRQMLQGNNFNRPALLELECAQMLQSLVPSAEMVKFAKDGSSILTAGIKLARAYTGRELVAICADSPFFSYNDWFIGTTPMDGGIPPAGKSLTVTFRYNDIGSLDALFERYPGQIAMVLLEPARAIEPRDGFLHKAREAAHRAGAVFMLDETISGFRFHRGGAQSVYGVTPDLSCFGKAMANGFSLSAQMATSSRPVYARASLMPAVRMDEPSLANLTISALGTSDCSIWAHSSSSSAGRLKLFPCSIWR